MSTADALFGGLALGCAANLAVIEIRFRLEARRVRRLPPMPPVPYANAEREAHRHRDEAPR